MSQIGLISVSHIAEELNAGQATVKFVLKRFKNWIPSEDKNGQSIYPVPVIKTIANIVEKLDMGVLPSDIEKDFKAGIQSGSPASPADNDIRLSKNGLNLLNDLFKDLGKQQKRIAEAHEKRAVVEERKAVAIEKRAEAEEKKAQAMNNIAAALQEMNRNRNGADTTADHITHQTVSALIEDESNFDMPAEDKSQMESPDNDQPLQTADPVDNLASLITDDDILEDLVLSEELPEVHEEELDQELTADNEETYQLLEMDDLSVLISEEKAQNPDIEKLDDLTALLDDSAGNFSDSTKDQIRQVSQTNTEPDDSSGSHDLDDLSKLIDSVSDDKTPKDRGEDTAATLDDLSALIDEDGLTNDNTERQPEMDNLSLLIDEPEDNTSPNAETKVSSDKIDDLSLLIEPSSQQVEQAQDQPETNVEHLDDLNELIEEPEVQSEDDSLPEVKTKINPDDDIEKYKAEIMQIIIGFKNDGLDAQKTTDILNKNSIKTLSGKPEWSHKAISQIYKFIESAA